MRESKDIFFFMFVFLIAILGDFEEVTIEIKTFLVLLLIQSYWVTINFTIAPFWYQFQMFSSGLFYLYVIISIKDDLNKTLIFNFIAIGAVIQSLWLIANYFGFSPYEIGINMLTYNVKAVYHSPGEIIGSLGNKNHSGALIALSFPALLRKKWVYLTPLCFIGLYFSQSTMPMLTAIGCILYYGYLRYFNYKLFPWVLFLLLSVLVSIFALNFSEYFSGTSRFVVWQKAIEVMSPSANFTGFGLGHFSAYFSKAFIVANQKFRHIHNEYIQLFYNFGIIGCIMVYYFVKRSILDTENKILLCGMFAVAINCFGNFTFHLSSLAFLSLTYFALSIKNGGPNVFIVDR